MSKITEKIRRIWHGVKRRAHRQLKLHPSSTPYLSGDTFRNLAQHIHDMDCSVVAEQVKNNDIVFVQSSKLKDFFTKIHPQISASYILISHNSDENITEKYLDFIDDKIIHWFAQNCLISHPKVTPLPIGIENKWYFLHGIPQYFNKLRKITAKKKPKILYKFNVSTNPSTRAAALNVLEKQPLAETYADWRKSLSYLNTLKQYSFVASPAGNGEDCHRTWEAMYLKTVPLVTDNPMSQYFESLGLPMIIISKWEDIQDMSRQDLDDLYAKIERRFDNPALYADFWIDKIKKYANVSRNRSL